jgi:hypothetical protein
MKTRHWNNLLTQFIPKYFLKQNSLKHIFRRGTTILKEKENNFCSMNEEVEPNRLEICLKELFLGSKKCRKKFIYWKVEIHHPTELTFSLTYLIAEFFVLGGKPELSQNLSFTYEERSILKSIGTIVFFQVLHWPNGYYVNLPSSDDY